MSPSFIQRGVWLVCLLVSSVFAHEGHDHDEAPPATLRGDRPQRLPDGRVLMPKASQRLLGLLTQPVQSTEVPRTLTLPGKVGLDPHQGGRVQAMIPGRIEAAGPHGLPSVGQPVKKGQVLAWVQPATGQLERSNQQALLAELQASWQLAEKRRQRLLELQDIAPRKDVEAAENEIASLRARLRAVQGGLHNRDALVAPVSGVIAMNNAAVGQVVAAGEAVFEIVNPATLHVEAQSYEWLAPEQIVAAQMVVQGQRIPLNFLGISRRLQDQTLPLLFEQHRLPAGVALPLGLPVQVFLTLRQGTPQQGWVVPQQALAKNSANAPVVWVKQAPEWFVARPVTTQPLDGVNVLVTQGLHPGDRVVVSGAAALSQVR